jgi:acyl-CoA synthetase (AMP-forming)/AMP-acid ligase II
MVNAFLVPLLRDRSVNLVDVWDPGEVLRLMREKDLGVSGGATFFLTSLLDHPDFTPEHLAKMPFAGLGGSSVPVPVTERLTKLGMKVFRSYGSTEHPSITGCRLADDEGYLTITDRVADVIIRGGENISAREVEELVAEIGGVAEVAVVATPDDRLGERAAAVIRPREGETAPDLGALREHLAAAGLARQKWPESVHVVADFPRTASGKVQKFVLRQQLRDGALG